MLDLGRMNDRAAAESFDLEHDVGQLVWLGFEGVHPPDELRRDIAAGRVGAVILFRRNLPVDTAAQAGGMLDIPALCALNQTLHECAPDDGPPLWIAVDQEGGRVQRIRAPAPNWPPMLTLGDPGGDASDSVPAAAERCRRVGEAMGKELAALGFDINFAPVLDVHTNEANPIIGNRAFARTPERAATTALAYADGLHRAGVLSCGKHFPGHGDTDTDSHLMLPRLSHELDRLRAVELAPFRRAAAHEMPMLMTAHVIFAALDERMPATLSERVIGEVLRRELGYTGIVVSDDLDMRAISAHFGIGEAAVRAVRAGCDALLLCRNRDHQRRAYDALIGAATSDPGLRARIAQSAARIRSAKRRHADSERSAPDANFAVKLFAEHTELLQTLL